MLVAVAQIAPVLLDRERTLGKVVEAVAASGARGAALVCFGEALVPGYPVWLGRTDAARFEAPDQKALHALYVGQAVAPAEGHLMEVCEAARRARAAVILGIVERAEERSRHSVFASRVFIDPAGRIASIHRKLMPTYEERLSWAMGDGAGLTVHRVGPFTVGALNCWENWMPLARAALYSAGEDLHVMLWPGRRHNTHEVTRFVAMESRSFVVSASGHLADRDIPDTVPQRQRLARPGEVIHDGGSCIAAPDGSWVVEPVTGREEIIVADLDPALVLRERQSFDPAGHYSRPDVLRLTVDRRRQSAAEFLDDPPAAPARED